MLRGEKTSLAVAPLRLWVRCYVLVILAVVLSVGTCQKKTFINGNNAFGSPTTSTRGMVIDAGSGGSRLHVFQWKPRVFSTVPPPLSYPESNEHWTARMDPGIHTFTNNLAGVGQHLAPLIDFARIMLVGSEQEFDNYPIYFKATGGMRELTVEKREAILAEVRKYLSDKSFCPFYFRDEFARVISGEEEAIFSWAATNFLKGTLLPASHGLGEVKNVNQTFGTLDLGGASTQIAFYLPSQDILEGLYKLQIGGQKEWNVYTKSFLEFGINSARLRHYRSLVEAYAKTKPAPSPQSPVVESACLHGGYSEMVNPDPAMPTTWAGYSASSIKMTGRTLANQFQACRALLRELMDLHPDSLCAEIYHGDCSIGGAYQPPLPHDQAVLGDHRGQHGHFLGTSTYKYAWTFLQLNETATLQQLDASATTLCQMSFADVQSFYARNHFDSGGDKLTDILPYSCFIATYISVLLQDGYGFYANDTVTVIDTINGHKVAWALGAILYEINQLPWELMLGTLEAHPYSFVAIAGVVGFFLGVVAAVWVYREILADKLHLHGEADVQPGTSPVSRAHYLYHRYQHLSQSLDNCEADEEKAGAGHRRGPGIEPECEGQTSPLFHAESGEMPTSTQRGEDLHGRSATNQPPIPLSYSSSSFSTSNHSRSTPRRSLAETKSSSHNSSFLAYLQSQAGRAASVQGDELQLVELQSRLPPNRQRVLSVDLPDQVTEGTSLLESKLTTSEELRGRLPDANTKSFSSFYSMLTPSSVRGSGWMNWVEAKPSEANTSTSGIPTGDSFASNSSDAGAPPLRTFLRPNMYGSIPSDSSAGASGSGKTPQP